MSIRDRVGVLLEELVNQVATLTSKGLLPEGDIEGLERAAGEAELFIYPQEPQPCLVDVADAPFNQLTPAEAERLAMLAEECSEVAQAAMKILRHGYESRHPKNVIINNRDELMKELGDVIGVMQMMIKAGDIYAGYIDEAADRAQIVKIKYTHHQ